MTIQQMFFGSSGAAAAKDINILLNGKWGSDSAEGASLATYWSSATQNNYTGQKANEYVQSDFTRVGDGILSFTLPAASYKIYARSGSGSGNNRWTGATATADLTLSSETPLLLLIPNHGSGNYGGGGGFFLIKGTDYTDSINNSALLILGGGGGGYMAVTTYGAPGNLSTSTGTRRGPSSGASGNYDHGAGWLDSYTVTPYSSETGTQARHFVEGGKGGTSTSCSTPGGFGGGGGGCPGGGGGHLGGYPGTDSHNSGTGYGGTGNSQYSGGGGGTSIYNASYVSNISASYGATNNSTLTSETQSDQGYFGIYTV